MLLVQIRTVWSLESGLAFTYPGKNTYILLLFMNVTNLEPNILLSERARRVIDDVFEALERTVSMRIDKTPLIARIPPNFG
jgi:hypothetical protein